MVTLREATIDDAPMIANLERDIFGATAWSPAMVRDELTAPHRYYTVLERAGIVVGYAGMLCIDIEADVQTIAVTEAVRGQRLGERLLEDLIDVARERGAEQMFLEVEDGNTAAIRLYERHGFQAIARREGYYQPEGTDAIVMHRMLTAERGDEH